MIIGLSKFAFRYSINQYGVGRIYREIYKINRKNVKDLSMRKNINETLKFIIRNPDTDVNQVIGNKNIQYLINHSKDDLMKSKAFSFFKQFL
tara:strand:- start:990 stop:1265 length:276 start_codon:yes stop_codon:yes gene_type:complete